MDERTFDDFVRRVAISRSRRGLLRGLAGGILATLGVGGGQALARPQGKVDICHRDGDSGSFTLLSVNGNAQQAHLNHGDHLPYDCDGTPSCTECGGTFVPPEQCYTGTAGAYPTVAPQAGYDDPWTVCEADEHRAWLSSATWGSYDPLEACLSLGYTSVGGIGGLGTMQNPAIEACGVWSDESATCGEPGTPSFEYGPWNSERTYFAECGGTGRICLTVHWECIR